MSVNGRDFAMISAYRREGFSKIMNSKVLVVGAGGIGCEILKNLSLSGFRDIELIDLDTIEVSNLNRQFLFRQEHVGHSKAVVAAEAVKRFNPEVRILAKEGNIKDSKFDTNYFSSFTIVLNALDNIDARNHVNRMCLASNVPLIDAGTTGYMGQVMPIFKGITACYECIPKNTPKTYPICTIRSTPDKPVHCIVWAKELFKLLFGNQEESMLYEDAKSGDTSTYMHLLKTSKPLSLMTFDELLGYGSSLLTALYRDEIEKRISMGTYKTAKTPPQAIAEKNIIAGITIAKTVLAGDKTIDRPSTKPGWDRNIWDQSECCAEFLLCICNMYTDDHYAELIRNNQLVFDKDDHISITLVCAAANLRCSVFNIPCSSWHDTKGIAGNIIPAIATTNAIVAALQVLQAVKYLTSLTRETQSISDDKIQSQFPHTYCRRVPTRLGYYLLPTACEKPSSKCYVCGTAQISLQIDTEEQTLEDFVRKVLKKRLGFVEPSVLMSLSGSIVYEEGEGADETLYRNLVKKLCDCPGGGIRDGTVLTIEDLHQNLNINVLIRHRNTASFEQDKPVNDDHFMIDGDAPVLTASSSSNNVNETKVPNKTASSMEESTKEDDDDDIEVWDMLRGTNEKNFDKNGSTLRESSNASNSAVYASNGSKKRGRTSSDMDSEANTQESDDLRKRGR